MIINAFLRSIQQLTDRAILRVLAKSALVTGLFFLVLGFAFYWVVDWLTELLVGWMSGWAYIAAYQEVAAALLAVAMGLLAFWLWFRAIAAALIPIFGDDVVQAVEQKHYPHALVRAHDIGFAEGLQLSLKSLGRTLGYNLLMLPFYIILAFTAIGLPILLLVVNGILIGRDFDDMMRARHGEALGLHHDAAKLYPSITRFLLGLITALILTIPLVNFLGMIIGTAMAAHLAQSPGVKSYVKEQMAA